MADPISISSGIAGLVTLGIQVTGVVYSYLHAVKDKSKNVKELHDELILLGGVLSKLQYFLASSAAKANDFDEPDSILSKAVAACKERVERIGEKLKPKESKLARAVDRLVWPFKEEELQKLMEALRRFRSTFEFAANIQGYEILSKTAIDARSGLEKAEQVAQQTKQLLEMQGMRVDEAVEQKVKLERILTLLTAFESTSNDVKEVSHAIRLQELREQERRKTEILDWLCPLSDLHKHKDVQSRRARGTGQWLLKTPEYRSWIRGDLQDLLCIGGPGVGKSVLCSLVVDELRDRHQDESDTCVVHYYFDYSEQQLQTDSHFARSVLRQVCVPSATIPEAVSTFYQKTRDVDRDRTWFQELQGILRRILSTFKNCYLVLDALDETEAVKQRTALFEVISSVRTDQNGLKVLATSRPHLDILSKQFPHSASIAITADPADLRQYLSYVIDTHPDAQDIMDSDSLKKSVLDKLVETAGGMFLLPSLQIKTILEQPTKADVQDILKTLSTDLTNVFDSTIARIRRLPIRSQEIAVQTLMWVSHAKRPLTMDELRHALAVRPNDTDINEDRLLSSRRIIDICSGLVEHEKDSNIVHLVHYTLEEYLTATDHRLFDSADLSILKTCLGYLTMGSLKPVPFSNRAEADRIMENMPFCHYACLEWGHHARNLDPVQYADLALPILNSSKFLLLIARIRDAKTPDSRKWRDRMWSWAYEDSGGAGISLAAGFGLTGLVRLLISQYAKPNLMARNMFGSTPLHEAAIYGHEQVAELLIAHGAKVDDVNKGRATPFYLAVSYGRLNMAKCLLRYDNKQLETQCRGGSTPLHKAVELDSDIMVEFLLAGGARIGSRDDRENTPLHIAALRGSLKIVRMLVLAGASVHSQNRSRLTPLDLAATGGNSEVAEYLIQNEANVFHKGQDQWSALHRAARGGHIDTVVVLLESGADLLDQDHRHHIPLHHAARAGHLETVQQLLEYSPDLKEQQLFHQDKTKATPKEVSFYTAHYDVHKYLRSLEWELLGTTTSITNKVTIAIERGDLTRLQTLLENGQAGLEKPDEDGQPPLHVAIQEGQADIAQFLLRHGASMEKTGYHGWRPLHVAASLGDLSMVDLCLQHGADVHSRTATGQQPIHKAASSKSLATVRRLIGAGADVESQNQRGMTPLLIAAHQNATDVVRALVHEYRADVLARDRHGETAIKWAEKGAHLETTKFLRIAQKKARERQRGSSGGGGGGLRRADASNGDFKDGRETPLSGEPEENEEEMGEEGGWPILAV